MQIIRSAVTRILDAIFTVLKLDVQESTAKLQALICFINIMFSCVPIVLYFVYRTNIHILFWMGESPQYANLSVPFTLCFLNFGVNTVMGAKMNAKQAQRTCFMLFAMLGAINFGTGLWVLIECNRVSEDLIYKCGESTLTARIEAEWMRLAAFYSACQVNQQKVMYIQECPGFAQAFPNTVYVKYIEDVEIDYNCVGFCQFWAPPLFNLDSDRGLRCATALGEEMDNIGRLIGMPTTMIGATIIGMGFCLFLYDHL